MAEVLLGVSGGIAAYKAIDLLRIMQRRGHGVTVVMTRNAKRFVAPATFAALSGRTVGVDLFGREERPNYDHLDLARAADVMVIAPASANTCARLAAGLGDGLLGATHLAFDGPLVLAPAMNTRMYLHPATEANLATLRGRGAHMIEPGSGLLADGEVGVGRLAEPAAIADAVDSALAGAGTLTGRRVLVSAGGTREPIDPVRYLGNRSSGRMGWAIARAARVRGARVTVLAANVDLPRDPGIEYVEAPTAAELHERALEHFPDCDLLVMAAAVADFRPRSARGSKIDKRAEGGQAGLSLDLEPTPDILSDLAGRRRRQVVVGFAAEHGEAGLARARDKRARKGLHLIVHNDVSEVGVGFGSDQNRVTIIGEGGEWALERMSKDACAVAILDAAGGLLPALA
ncbi:MAG: bifunctional phosphopantothenoylcysteine decarboxylase/phosphopantothenate--cysteine ligase CoaBC [Miltoncostaeaceae bacterium]